MFIHPLMVSVREPQLRLCAWEEMLSLRGSRIRGVSRDFMEVKPTVGYRKHQQCIPPSSEAGGAIRELVYACAILVL